MTKLELPIAITEAGCNWVSLEPVPALPDAHSLVIGSQWLVAKDPGEIRTQVQLTLAHDDLVLLHQWLGRYLQAN